MSNTLEVIPTRLWYILNEREPIAVQVIPGDDIDSEGHDITHFANWDDARAAMLVDAHAGRKIRTRQLNAAETRLSDARTLLGAVCQELEALEKLTEPDEPPAMSDPSDERANEPSSEPNLLDDVNDPENQKWFRKGQEASLERIAELEAELESLKAYADLRTSVQPGNHHD